MLSDTLNSRNLGATSNLISEESTAHSSSGAHSFAYGQSNMMDQQTTGQRRLARSNSLDHGIDPMSLPPLGETTKIRPPLLPHRPRAPPDYDTVSRAKKKAASAYNLSSTDAGDDFFISGVGRGNSAFNPFRSNEFLFGDTGASTSRGGTTSSTSQTKYSTMESSSRSGTVGVDAGYNTMEMRNGTKGDFNNSFGFETGTGGSGGTGTSSMEKSFSSSAYGTSIGAGGLDGGLTNGSGILYTLS